MDIHIQDVKQESSTEIKKCNTNSSKRKKLTGELGKDDTSDLKLFNINNNYNFNIISPIREDITSPTKFSEGLSGNILNSFQQPDTNVSNLKKLVSNPDKTNLLE